MLRLKQFGWLALRFCVLGPLAAIAVLGCWAEELFEYLSPLLGPDDLED